MADNQSIGSYLSIPNRMARSGSHESFATDLSLLSISSFTSDTVSRRLRLSIDIDELDENPEMAKFREEMLEKMLETQTTSALRSEKSSKRKKGSKQAKTRFSEDTQSLHKQITDSEEDLLQEQANHSIRNERNKNRAILYKSFSSADLEDLDHVMTVGMKTCSSQAWMPGQYAQLMQSRKKLIRDMKQAGDDGAIEFCSPKPEKRHQQNNSQKRVPAVQITEAKDDDEESPSNESRRAISAENIPLLGYRKRSPGPLMRRLKFSKEIGRRIRDDLLKKINKQKDKIVTKSDLEKEKGRPITKSERNFMIFHWLQSLDDESFEEP